MLQCTNFAQMARWVNGDSPPDVGHSV